MEIFYYRFIGRSLGGERGRKKEREGEKEGERERRGTKNTKGSPIGQHQTASVSGGFLRTYDRNWGEVRGRE